MTYHVFASNPERLKRFRFPPAGRIVIQTRLVNLLENWPLLEGS